MILKDISKVVAMGFAIVRSFLLDGCASGDGGQVVSGILHGIGQGLSGLQMLI